MSKPNFIGKQLINIKDKMPTLNVEGNQAKAQNAANPKQEDVSESAAKIEEGRKTPAIEIDKAFIKALNSKKEDYFKTKNVVLKVLGDSLSELKKELADIEQRREVYSSYIDSTETLQEEILQLNESEWDAQDFSLNLAEAERTVERARLENIILKEKLSQKSREKPKNDALNGFSILDIMSLSFLQVFKLGFGFFLPLIIGIIMAALIVAVTILISMGTL